METIKTGLQASLLVKHPETDEIFVNFDPDIFTLIRETECMIKLGLEIPPAAKSLRAKRELMKKNFNMISVSFTS